MAVGDKIHILTKIDSTHKLNADWIDSTGSTAKTVTETEKTTWNAKADPLHRYSFSFTVYNSTLSNNVIYSGTIDTTETLSTTGLSNFEVVKMILRCMIKALGSNSITAYNNKLPIPVVINAAIASENYNFHINSINYASSSAIISGVLFVASEFTTNTLELGNLSTYTDTMTGETTITDISLTNLW